MMTLPFDLHPEIGLSFQVSSDRRHTDKAGTKQEQTERFWNRLLLCKRDSGRHSNQKTNDCHHSRQTFD
jgi:hypothetical protein